MTVLKLYTDGACANNQEDVNFGGWGTILEYGEHTKELYGGGANTTNNRMELMAVIEGFKALKREGLEVEVFSDSSYVMNCFREKWYVNWQRMAGKTPKNSLLKTASFGKNCWNWWESTKSVSTESKAM